MLTYNKSDALQLINSIEAVLDNNEGLYDEIIIKYGCNDKLTVKVEDAGRIGVNSLIENMLMVIVKGKYLFIPMDSVTSVELVQCQ